VLYALLEHWEREGTVFFLKVVLLVVVIAVGIAGILIGSLGKSCNSALSQDENEMGH